MSRRASALLMLAALSLSGCASELEAEPSPPCDQACQDGNAIRAVRESMKLVYNLTLQGNPVGMQDEISPCPQGGFARVAGTATSNSMQGATEVELAYVFQACSYLRRDEDPGENHNLVMTGVIGQKGTIAVQPTATTALLIASESITLSGTVYDPPIEYAVEGCELLLSQTGNDLSGTICGRAAGVDL
jgi:hypothetical protein